MKKGFTLAEVLIVILIIGFLAIISLSALTKAAPKKNKVLFKKAYSVAERIVGEMANDEALYPYVDRTVAALQNVEQVKVPGVKDNDGNLLETDANLKFCQIFHSKLNTSSDIIEQWNNDDICSFQTNDGIAWYVKHATDAFEGGNAFGYIAISTKGDLDELNQYVNGGGLDAEFETQINDDKHIFRIKVFADGRVTAVDATEKDFLKNQSVKGR